MFGPLHTLRHAGPIQSLLLIGNLYLGGVWLVVDLRTDTKMTCVYKRLDYMCSQVVNHSRLNTQHN